MEAWLIRMTDYLLAQSWQIAVLTLVVACASFVLRNRSAHVRYLLWLIILAKALVPPLYSIPVAVWPQRAAPEYIPAPPVAGTMMTEPEPRGEGVPPLRPEGILPSTRSAPSPVGLNKPARYSTRAWLAMGWLAGVVALSLYYLANALRTQIWLRRRRRALPSESARAIVSFFTASGVRCKPRIWLLERINQPFVWGLVRGSIYLPARLLDDKHAKFQPSLLGHELSHVMRLDAMINSLQVIAQTIFWFHPFVWWANAKIRAEREKCCDEMTIARLKAPPEEYGEAIIETLAAKYEQARPVPSLAVAGQVKNIEERIRTMLKPGKRFHKRPSLIAAIIVSLSASFTVPTALVLTAQAATEKGENELGKLEYVDHLTREDLSSVTSIGISPDGRYAYASAYNVFSLVVFKRNPETGYLEHIQTIVDQKDLNGSVSLRLSPNGRYAVCTSFRSNTVSLFERDSSNGLLAKLDTFRQSEHGGEGLSWVIDAVFSPDSKFIYTAANHGQGASVSTFRITDQKTLELIQTNSGEDKCFAGARAIAISPKGDSLYVPSYQTSALVVLDREAESGRTKLRQVLKDETGGVHGLESAFSVTCSPDNKFVYCSAGRFSGDSAISVFKRETEGTLSLVQEIFDGQEGLTGFLGGNELKVSPDGHNLYALGSRSNSVVVFGRDTETGRLTYLQTFYDSDVAGKDGSASGITISPDGEYIYVAGEFDSSLLIFKRLAGTEKEGLHKAAFLGDIAQVKSLIAKRVDLNEIAERGYAPLHWAVKVNQKDGVELLISAGADINIRTGENGWTPLQIAIIQGNKSLAEWLISKGAKLNIENRNNGLTPLLIAGMGGKADLVQLLLSNGANINERDRELNTPLHCAARDGHIDVAETLIDNGADVKAKNNRGDTALHYAAMNGRTSVTQLLIEKGAEIDTKTKYGFTPLIYAALWGRRDIAEVLLSKGADINAKDNQGRDALWWARTRKRTRIVELLKKHGAKE